MSNVSHQNRAHLTADLLDVESVPETAKLNTGFVDFARVHAKVRWRGAGLASSVSLSRKPPKPAWAASSAPRPQFL